MAMPMPPVNQVGGDREPVSGLRGDASDRRIDLTRCGIFRHNAEANLSPPTHRVSKSPLQRSPLSFDDGKQDFYGNSPLNNMNMLHGPLSEEDMSRRDDFSVANVPKREDIPISGDKSFMRVDQKHSGVRKSLLNDPHFASHESIQYPSAQNPHNPKIVNSVYSDFDNSGLRNNRSASESEFLNNRNNDFRSQRPLLDKQSLHLLDNKGYNSDNDILKGNRTNKKYSADSISSGKSHYKSYKKRGKGHRRAQSGDAALFHSNERYSKFENEGYSHNSPQDPRERFDMENPRGTILHSQSSGCIEYPRVDSRYPPPLLSSMSVDATTANKNVHEHLCLQSTSFVHLQSALSAAVKYCEQLEREVEFKNGELNDRLNVTQNPTAKECGQLEAEIICLEKDIQLMTNQCDKLGIQVLGDTLNPFTVQFQPIPTIPLSPIDHSSPITTQPPSYISPTATHSLPGFNQAQKNEKTLAPNDNRYLSLQPTNPSVQQLPHHQPHQLAVTRLKQEKDSWFCPRCTFENLLVPECEMCYTPRPVALR